VTGNAHWNPLAAELGAAPVGYAQRDLALFSYANDPSGAGVPCQDAVISSQQLDKFLQAERVAGHAHAVLVGHSFGGLLSALTAMIDPSLTTGPQPLVRSS